MALSALTLEEQSWPDGERDDRFVAWVENTALEFRQGDAGDARYVSDCLTRNKIKTIFALANSDKIALTSWKGGTRDAAGSRISRVLKYISAYWQ